MSTSPEISDFGVTSNDELELILRNADSNTVTVEEVRVSDESNTAEWIDEESIGVGDTGSVTLQEVGEGDGADTLDMEIIYSSGGLENLQVEGSISGNFEVIEDSTALAADFSYDPDNPEPGEAVSFDASGSSGEITSYDWDFDDGSTETGESVDHSFSDEDDYSVELTVEDEEGNTDSSESVVSVSSVHPASFDLTSVGDNSPVLEGENFEVSYSVENSGGEIDTQDIILEVDGVQEDSVSHTLDSGESESDTLVWSTVEGDNGDDIGYSVSSGDDSFSGSVTVEEVATAGLSSLDVAGQGGDATVDEGEVGGVSVGVENVGDESGSFSVDLSIENGESVSDTESTPDLDSGQSEAVTFSDPISGLSAYSYSVDVEVSGDDTISGSLTVEGGEVSSPSVGGEWSRVEPAGAEGGYNYFFDSSTTPYGTTYGGNSSVEYTDDGFFIMKYQAAQNSTDGSLPVSNGDAGWFSISFNDDSAQSGPSSYTACENLDDETSSFDVHLMTNREWMTVARQVAQNSSNWADNDIGSTGDEGGLYQGQHSEADDLDRAIVLGEAPSAAGEGEPGEVERTHNLSSGDQVWDLSGDLNEWVDVDENGTKMSGDSSSKLYERTAMNSTVSGGDGLGTDSGFNVDWHAALRGGIWHGGDNAGVFGADSNNPGSSISNHGFRCSAVPVS